MTIPDDLQEGWGFPDLTDTDRHNILGRNFARLMDVDLDTAPRNESRLA
jgi:hypothetical protein